MLNDAEKLTHSFLACLQVVEDRNQMFMREYEQSVSGMTCDLGRANLKMLLLRMYLRTKHARSSTLALELQDDFEEADCLLGEGIAFYFLYQVSKIHHNKEQQVVQLLNRRLDR